MDFASLSLSLAETQAVVHQPIHGDINVGCQPNHVGSSGAHEITWRLVGHPGPSGRGVTSLDSDILLLGIL